MKLSDILANIDTGSMSLPRFQRGFVWSREQVRALFTSLYREHPIGSLLIWVTASEGAEHRGGHALPPGVVKLLLDGQQRITTLYSVARGQAPAFFDGDKNTLVGLRFNIKDEVFEFHQPLKMKGDARWIDVSAFLQAGVKGILPLIRSVGGVSDDMFNVYHERLTRLLAVLNVDIPAQEVVGEDKTVDVVVDIFNQVNSRGTTLSSGDLALAKICAGWPDAREEMKSCVQRWNDLGYSFNLVWLLRCVNTVLTGRSEFHHLHGRNRSEIQDGLGRATKHIDYILDLIGNRLGLDHARVLMGPFAIPVLARYLDQRERSLNTSDEGLLLFWYLQAGMWGRFSGSTETRMNQDIQALETEGILGLVDRLRLWRGGMRVEADHFDKGTMGARFYGVLYCLTRMGQARDFCSGDPLKKGLLAKSNALEVHHIFPKSVLRKHRKRYSQKEINALANLCFLTKACNLKIGAKPPEQYFPEVDKSALESQWIPTDPDLWVADNFRDFLRERRRLLAQAANAHLARLAAGSDRLSAEFGDPTTLAPMSVSQPLVAESSDESDESVLDEIQNWMREKQMPTGDLSWDLADETSGAQLAVADIAWPDGIQVGRGEPVALLLDADKETLGRLSQRGFRCFTDVPSFKGHVQRTMS